MPVRRSTGVAAAVIAAGVLASSCGPPQGAQRSRPAATVPASEAASPEPGGAEVVPPDGDDSRRPSAGPALEDACSLLPVEAVEALLGGRPLVVRAGRARCAWSTGSRRAEVSVAIEAITDLRTALERYQAGTDVHEAVSGIAAAALVTDPRGKSARIAVFGDGWLVVLRAPGRSTHGLSEAARALVKGLSAE